MAVFNIRKWFRISLFSFLVVAILGTLMRYKIAFEFPYFNQKYIQYAHSHFAFSAWVSQLLMAYLINIIQQSTARKDSIKVYSGILWANLIIAYCMLVSFAIQGYGLYSILFSTLSILLSFYFCVTYWLQLRKSNIKHKSWFYAAMVFNVLSAAGMLVVIIMMATKNIHQEGYLASIYWYLHFQYNGWFFFAIVGLFIHYLTAKVPEITISKWVFRLFAISCIPAFGLSVLWAKLPLWVYIFVVLAAFMQVAGWILLIVNIAKGKNYKSLFEHKISYFLILYLGITISVKFLLQLGSVLPELSQLAFGFRPIVIAYLHLILLAIISTFLISYAIINGFTVNIKLTIVGVLIITAAIFLNELILAVQGIASLSYTLVPYVNELLFIAAALIMTGIIVFIYSQLNYRNSA